MPHTTQKGNTMAQLDFTFIPTQSAANSSNVTVDEIPEDVRKDVEAVYAALKTNPNGRMRVTFASKTEALQWIAVASTYCKIRTAGPIRFRRSPTKGLAENVVDFRISDIPKTGTDEIREAAAALADSKTTVKPAK